MEPSAVERAVREWLDAHSINPATGVPPDARVAVAVSRITPFGESAIEPPSDIVQEQFSVTATLFFPEEDEADLQPKITRILDRFREALSGTPAVGGGDVALEWRGAGDYPVAHLDTPAGYHSSVDVLLTARAFPGVTRA